jgi:D-3-phosphoglycerate dehydrogenase
VELESQGFEVAFSPELTADDLVQSVGDTEILVVRSTKVTNVAIEAAPKLGLIVRAGSGYNTIDVAAASDRGIHVANCPGKNADAVAELAMGLLIAADRQIVNATVDLRNGRWRKKHYARASGLKGRTLGLIGFGAIGRGVAKRAQGMAMNVVAWSRSLTPEAAAEFGIECAPSPMHIAETCDAVSIHLPLTDDTHHFVNEAFLAARPDDSILINTSRGELVDTAALAKAIEAKRLRVGLDVFEDEPSGGDAEFGQGPLARLVTCTPHVGASTDQTSEAIAAEVVRIVSTYCATGRPPGAVNLAESGDTSQQLVVRHLNQVGVLASVLDGLKGEQINVAEMENTIFAGGKAASCSLRLDGCPSESLLADLRSREAILHIATT